MLTDLRAEAAISVQIGCSPRVRELISGSCLFSHHPRVGRGFSRVLFCQLWQLLAMQGTPILRTKSAECSLLSQPSCVPEPTGEPCGH